MGSLQLVLRKINRINDSKYNIYNIWCSNLIILDNLIIWLIWSRKFEFETKEFHVTDQCENSESNCLVRDLLYSAYRSLIVHVIDFKNPAVQPIKDLA